MRPERRAGQAQGITAKLWPNNKPLEIKAKRADDLVTLSAQLESLLEPLGNYEAVVKWTTERESHKKWRLRH